MFYSRVLSFLASTTYLSVPLRIYVTSRFLRCKLVVYFRLAPSI